MLNKLPLGIWPAKSAAAVGPDKRFVAELIGTLEVDVEVPELEAVDVLEFVPCREAIWAFTRLSARWLAMPARPVARLASAVVKVDESAFTSFNC